MRALEGKTWWKKAVEDKKQMQREIKMANREGFVAMGR